MKEVSELTYEEHQKSIKVCKASAIGGFATAAGGTLLFAAEAISEIEKTGFDMSSTVEHIAAGSVAVGLIVGGAAMIRSVPHSVYNREDCPPSTD